MKQLYCMAISLVLISCTTTNTPKPTSTPQPTLLPSPTLTPTPYPLLFEVPAGGRITIPLKPGGKPESNPTLTFGGLIIDNFTYQPVTADVYIIDSDEDRAPLPNELVLRGTENFEIDIHSRLDGWIVVRAPGYADWRLRMRFRIKTSRRAEQLIEMQKLPGDTTL